MTELVPGEIFPVSLPDGLIITSMNEPLPSNNPSTAGIKQSKMIVLQLPCNCAFASLFISPVEVRVVFVLNSIKSHSFWKHYRLNNLKSEIIAYMIQYFFTKTVQSSNLKDCTVRLFIRLQFIGRFLLEQHQQYDVLVFHIPHPLVLLP